MDEFIIHVRSDDAVHFDTHHAYLLDVFKRIMNDYIAQLAKRATHTPTENHMGSDLPLNQKNMEDKI